MCSKKTSLNPRDKRLCVGTGLLAIGSIFIWFGCLLNNTRPYTGVFWGASFLFLGFCLAIKNKDPLFYLMSGGGLIYSFSCLLAATSIYNYSRYYVHLIGEFSMALIAAVILKEPLLQLTEKLFPMEDWKW